MFFVFSILKARMLPIKWLKLSPQGFLARIPDLTLAEAGCNFLLDIHKTLWSNYRLRQQEDNVNVDVAELLISIFTLN